jgi:hypothetical protein
MAMATIEGIPTYFETYGSGPPLPFEEFKAAIAARTDVAFIGKAETGPQCRTQDGVFLSAGPNEICPVEFDYGHAPRPSAVRRAVTEARRNRGNRFQKWLGKFFY